MLHASDDACNAEQQHLSAAIRRHVRGPNLPRGRHARRTLATRGAVLLLLAVGAHEVTGGTGELAVGRGAGWSEWRDQHAIFSLARSRDRRAPRCLALALCELDLQNRRARALFPAKVVGFVPQNQNVNARSGSGIRKSQHVLKF